MSRRVRAFFDGEVLRPDDPTGLKPNARYLLTIEGEEDTARAGEGGVYPLTEILDLATDMGVPDLSARHSWYAHGRLEDGGRAT